MSKIQTTHDYSKFQFCELNRQIDKGHVRKLRASMSSNNLLEFCPILVNEKMEIIDGQHRFLAAKEINSPIFYQIKDGAVDEDIILLNVSSKKWVLQDYVNYYAKKGNSNYQKIVDLSEKYSLSVSIILNLFGREYDGFKEMKQGKLRDLDMKTAKSKIDQLMEITSIIKQYLTKTYGQFIKNCRFLRSLVVFLADEEIDFDEFKKRVYWRVNTIRVCATISEYMDMWNAIYSYRRKKEEV